MAIVLPHSFQDNVEEIASGVQVDENFDVLKAAIEAAEGTVAQHTAQLSGLITAAGPIGSLRMQAGKFVVPGYGGGRGGFDIALPVPWPLEHLLVLAQCSDDASHIAYGPCSGFVLSNATFHLDIENGPNFSAAHASWISIGR